MKVITSPRTDVLVILYAIYGYCFSASIFAAAGWIKILNEEWTCGGMKLTAACVIIFLFFETVVKPTNKGNL